MPVKEIVSRFGGQSALARRLGKRPGTVAYWVKTDSVPARWQSVLLQLASSEGIALSASDFVKMPSPLPLTSGSVMPIARYAGSFRVGEATINCYVLDDGRRIISRTSATDFLTQGSGGGNLESYIGVRALEGFVPRGWQENLVEFTLPEVTNKQPSGITAETFLGICWAYMRARDSDALSDRQVEIAKRAGAFVLACSGVGITALIDEATGFQYERAEDALQFKLRLYLEDEMRAWEKTFPDQLWTEFGRLTGWSGPISSRPKYWGKLVMELVYGYLDVDVAEWLKQNAPQPRHGQNYHQWLSDQYGLKKLTEHLWMLIGIAGTCESMNELRRRMAERFGKVPVQPMLFTDLRN